MALKDLIYAPLKMSNKRLQEAYNIINREGLNTLEALEHAKQVIYMAWMGYKGVEIYLNNSDILIQDLYGDSLRGIIRYRLSKRKKKTLADVVDAADLKYVFNLAQAEAADAYGTLSSLLEAFSNDRGYIVVSSDDEISFRTELHLSDRGGIGVNTSLEDIVERSLKDVEGILSNIDLRMELVKKIDKEFELPEFDSKNDLEKNLEGIVEYLVARVIVFYLSLNEFLLDEKKVSDLHNEVDNYTEDVLSLMNDESVISWKKYRWGRDYSLNISYNKAMKFILKYTVNVVLGLDNSLTDGEDRESLRVVKQDLPIERIADEFFSQ